MKGRNRSGRRAPERGATLFVVVLAITLLTGVGLYTVHASSLSARAAGYGREALQAERTAEISSLALLSTLRVEGRPYVQEAVNANPGKCEMNAGLPDGTSCLQVTSDGVAPPTGAGLIGTDSLSPIDTSTGLGTLTGKARMEITEVNELKIPIPGHDVHKEELEYYQATVTAIGSLNSSSVPSNICVAGLMQVTGQHMLRAHLILGPMPKVWKQAGY